MQVTLQVRGGLGRGYEGGRGGFALYGQVVTDVPCVPIHQTNPPPLPSPPTHPQANTLQLKTAWLIDNRSSSYHITTARNFVVNFWGIILRTSPNPRGVTPDRRMRTIQQDLPSSVRPSIMATSSPIISGEQSVVGASSGDTSRRMEARHASGGGTSHVYQ